MWVFRNRDSGQTSTGTLLLADALRPAWSVNLNTGARSPVTDGQLPVYLPPAEMAIYVTPRSEIAGASSDWFELQRGWWQGSADPGKPLPKPTMKLALDITDGWAFQPVDPRQADLSPFLGPNVDDSAWKQVSLGIFTLPDYPDCRHAVIRKRIHVPGTWNRGRVLIHLPGFRTGAGAYLDGQPIKRDTALAGGSQHVLAVDIRSNGFLMGADGPAWLSYHPDPAATQDLAGAFRTSTDFLTWSKSIPLPGEIAQGTRALRTDFTLLPAAAGKTVVLHGMENSGELKGAIVNGHYVVPGVREGPELNLNVTPWVKPGVNNEIVLLMGGSHETITALALEFHQKGAYP